MWPESVMCVWRGKGYFVSEERVWCVVDRQCVEEQEWEWWVGMWNGMGEGRAGKIYDGKMEIRFLYRNLEWIYKEQIY